MKRRSIAAAGVLTAAGLVALFLLARGPGRDAPGARPSTSDTTRPAGLEEISAATTAGERRPAGVSPSIEDERRSSAPRPLLFRFVDRASARAVPGVVVRRLSGIAADDVLGESDADGLLRVDAEPDGAQSRACVADHPRFAATRFVAGRWPGVAPGEAQTVVLDAAATIEGTARIAAGLPIPPGVLALAWPEERGSLFGMSREQLLSDPEVRVAEVDPDGSFSIDGVHPAAAHRVAVGGAGWSSGSGASGVRAGDDPVVYIGAVYGARLDLTETSGGGPRVNHGYSGRGYGTPEAPPDAPALRWTDPWSPSVALNLMGRDGLAGDARAFGERWLVFSTAEFPAGVVPDRFEVLFRADLPGYEPLDRDVGCAWLANSALEHQIQLVETGQGFGELRLRIDPPDRIELLAADAALRFTPTAGSSRPFSLLVEGARRTADGFEWSGVPAGTHALALTGRVAGAEIPVSTGGGAREVTVAPGGRVDVRAEVDLGALELVVTRDGTPFAGALFVTWKASDGRGGQRTLHAPPYRIHGLVPGPLELRVLRPRRSAGEGARAPQTIEVEAAEQTRVDIALD